MIKYAIFIMSFFIYNVHLLFSSAEVESKFNRANEYYTKGNFNQAIKLYKEIIYNNFESPELYFNLGNAYYKLKDVPNAILYYERAKLLAPNDEDIEFNLNVANLRTVDKINKVPEFFLYAWFNRVRDLFSSESWSILTIVFSWLTFIFLALFFTLWQILARKIFFSAAVLFFLLNISCILFAHQAYTKETAHDYAIIFAPSVFMKSSPDENSTKLVSLHEGTKVKILDEVGGWKKVRLADGNVGWLPESTIEII